MCPHVRTHTHSLSYLYVHEDFITGQVGFLGGGGGRAGGRKEREPPWGLWIERIEGSSWWTVQRDLGNRSGKSTLEPTSEGLLPTSGLDI